MQTEQTRIYVELLDEGTECWRPVLAAHVREDIYRIIDSVPEGEVWRFQPGDVVRCKQRQFSDGTCLTARELATND